MRLVAFASVLLGCAIERPDSEQTEPIADTLEEPDLGPKLRVVAIDGQAHSEHDAKHDVFIDVRGADDIDYVFRVIDLQGNEVSMDDVECRHVHVARPCQHVTVGGLVQLMPFADTDTDEQGVMHYLVQLTRAGDNFERSSLKATFAIVAPPSS